ncbi:hypothetical protein BpHYR1_026934 [Brachionus plicatilis]|uniref:Uncharacterized protein n=1 Tax=Brachionus plicatilis TaxID=10195 RepID=A0A3M7QAN1_BRAPC|nr:hypothetical protein BpHYR1_026934 [Brachionus plicatilis]
MLTMLIFNSITLEIMQIFILITKIKFKKNPQHNFFTIKTDYKLTSIQNKEIPNFIEFVGPSIEIKSDLKKFSKIFMSWSNEFMLDPIILGLINSTATKNGFYWFNSNKSDIERYGDWSNLWLLEVLDQKNQIKK